MKSWLAFLILAAGCVNPTEPAPFEPTQEVTLIGDVELTFRAQVDAGEVLVFADLRSVGADTGSLQAGTCAFGVRGKGAFGHMWDNHPPPSACAGAGLSIVVGPGELQSVRIYRHNATILRQQVPAGPYDITVLIRLDGKLESHFAGQVQL